MDCQLFHGQVDILQELENESPHEVREAVSLQLVCSLLTRHPHHLTLGINFPWNVPSTHSCSQIFSMTRSLWRTPRPDFFMIRHPCYVDKTGGNPSDLVSVDTTQIVYCEFIAYDQGMKKLVCSIFVLLSLRDYTPKKAQTLCWEYQIPPLLTGKMELSRSKWCTLWVMSQFRRGCHSSR